MINDLVDSVFCINMRHRKQKRMASEKIFLEFGIEYSIWPGINGKTDKVCLDLFRSNKKDYLAAGIRTPGAIGIYFSVINLVEHAKRAGHKSICLFEDDFLLANDFNSRIDGVTVLGSNYDMVYLGASQHDWAGVQPFDDNFYLANKTQGLFGVIINSSIYDDIISLKTSIVTPIDNAISKKVHFRKKSYVFRDNIVIADTKTSDTRNDSRPLDAHSKKMKWNTKMFSKSLIKRGYR